MLDYLRVQFKDDGDTVKTSFDMQNFCNWQI